MRERQFSMGAVVASLMLVACTEGPRSYAVCESDEDCPVPGDTCIAALSSIAAPPTCTRRCSADSECPGGRCVDMGDGAVCRQACSDASECVEEGWACRGPDLESRVCQWTLPAPESSSYEACSESSPCTAGGDTCLPAGEGSLCTRECSDASDCGDDLCYAQTDGASVCIPRCRSSEECPRGLECHTGAPTAPDACLPGVFGVDPFGACDLGASRNVCRFTMCTSITVDGASGAMCTRACAEDDDCPDDALGFEGRCEDLTGAGESHCYGACKSDAYCPEGWSCRSETSLGSLVVPVCVPAGG